MRTCTSSPVGRALHEVDLAHAPSLFEAVRRTVAFAATSQDPWIIGDGWDQNLWPDKAFPTHDALSAALPDRPVVLDRVDGHAVLANAKAMALGVDASTAEPAEGASCATPVAHRAASSSTTHRGW